MNFITWMLKMGRMDFIADERVAPPCYHQADLSSVHSRDGFDRNTSGAKVSMFLKRDNWNVKYFHFHTISLVLG